MVKLAQDLGTLEVARTIQRHVQGAPETNVVNASDNQKNAVLYLYASSDIVGASGRTNKESHIKFSAAFDPVDQAKGLNQTLYSGFNPNTTESSALDSLNDISIRNLRANGTANVISTASSTDLINRTELSVSETAVNFKTISGVNPVDPNNVLNNVNYTNITNAIDGASLTGVKTLTTKNKSDTVTFGMNHTVSSGTSILQITKKIGNGSTTVIGVFT